MCLKKLDIEIFAKFSRKSQFLADYLLSKRVYYRFELKDIIRPANVFPALGEDSGPSIR